MKFLVDQKRTHLYPLISGIIILVIGLLNLNNDIYYILFMVGVGISISLSIVFLISFKYIKKPIRILTVILILTQLVLLMVFSEINITFLLLLEFTPLIVFLSITHSFDVTK